MDAGTIQKVRELITHDPKPSLDHRLLLNLIDSCGRDPERVQEVMDRNPDYRRMFNMLKNLVD